MSMSEVFSVPFLTLIKLCYTKALEWSSLVPGSKGKSSSDITTLTSFTVRYHEFAVHFSSFSQLCPTLCDPMDCSTPGLPSTTNSWSLLKLMSIESVMPSNHLILLSSPSTPALNLSQHQGLFQWVSSSHQVAKVLEFQLQHQSVQWMLRTDFL